MEKKTTQRIVGILVAFALVVILMPIVFSKTDVSAQTASIKAPPFPDQQQSTGVADNTSTTNTVVITQEMANKMNGEVTPPLGTENTTTAATNTESQPSVAKLTEQSTPMTMAANTDSLSTSAASPLSDQANAAVTPVPDQASATKATEPNPVVAANNADQAKVISGADAQSAATENPKMASAASTDPLLHDEDEQAPAEPKLEAAKPAMVHAVDTKSADDGEGLVIKKTVVTAPKIHKQIRTALRSSNDNKVSVSSNLKQMAWVVQMGSFRDKTNARQLADRLRSSGFKAFLHEARSKHGTQTRVYVGPEYKQVAALKLSNKVEQEAKMRGVVVIYNPLEL